MKISLGYKVNTNISFALPTRGLNMGFGLIPYVKKATYMTSCYVET